MILNDINFIDPIRTTIFVEKSGMIFTEHKTTVQQVVGLIPEGLLSTLAINTKVDYCAKVLQGERLFYLLIYAILKSDRISQRYLEDVFKSAHFKFLFNYSVDMKVSHSSISEKLSKINMDYFRLAYEQIYERYAQLYSPQFGVASSLRRVKSKLLTCIKTTNNESEKANKILYIKAGVFVLTQRSQETPNNI